MNCVDKLKSGTIIDTNAFPITVIGKAFSNGIKYIIFAFDMSLQYAHIQKPGSGIIIYYTAHLFTNDRTRYNYFGGRVSKVKVDKKYDDEKKYRYCFIQSNEQLRTNKKILSYNII